RWQLKSAADCRTGAKNSKLVWLIVLTPEMSWPWEVATGVLVTPRSPRVVGFTRLLFTDLNGVHGSVSDEKPCDTHSNAHFGRKAKGLGLHVSIFLDALNWRELV